MRPSASCTLERVEIAAALVQQVAGDRGEAGLLRADPATDPTGMQHENR